MSWIVRSSIPGGSVITLPGVGGPTAKSAELSSVSVSGLGRAADVVFDVVAAGPDPSNDAVAPYPTKSRTAASATQLAPHGSGVWFVTRATLPLVALIAIDPAAFGGGNGVVPPAPWASWTR